MNDGSQIHHYSKVKTMTEFAHESQPIHIKSKIKCNTKGDRNWRHIAITPGRLTSLVAKPRR